MLSNLFFLFIYFRYISHIKHLTCTQEKKIIKTISNLLILLNHLTFYCKFTLDFNTLLIAWYVLILCNGIFERDFKSLQNDWIELKLRILIKDR